MADLSFKILGHIRSTAQAFLILLYVGYRIVLPASPFASGSFERGSFRDFSAQKHSARDTSAQIDFFTGTHGPGTPGYKNALHVFVAYNGEMYI